MVLLDWGVHTKDKPVVWNESWLEDLSVFFCPLLSSLKWMNAVESFHTFAISHRSSPHPTAPLNSPLLLCSVSPPNLHPPVFNPPFHFSSLLASVPEPPLPSSHLSPPPIVGTLIQSHSSSHTASPAHKAPSHSFIVPVYCLFTATARHKSIIFPNGKSTLTWEDTPFPS